MPTSPPLTPSMFNWLSPSPPIAGRQDVATHALRAIARVQRPTRQQAFLQCLAHRKPECPSGHRFPLRLLAGVEIGFKFQGFTKPFSSHTRVSTYNIADTVDQAHETSDRETEANDAPLHIGSEPYTSLPRLVPGYPWPSLLRNILGFADNAEQRDILLLTALTALGATLGKTVRCLYGMHWIYPCIQLFVIAPPASGKGIMAWLRKFIEPIHREIRQQVDLAMKQYRQDLAAYHALGKEKAKMEMPQMPKNSMFIISGNNTGTGILQNIIDSDGTGIIFETEADTITTAIGGDYGHWSDTLQNAFDHAGLSFNRRTDNEYRECDSPSSMVPRYARTGSAAYPLGRERALQP